MIETEQVEDRGIQIVHVDRALDALQRPLADPMMPVVMNARALPVTAAAEVRGELLDQVCSTVMCPIGSSYLHSGI